MKDGTENLTRLVTLNIMATQEEISIFGKGLKDVCDMHGFKFELQGKDLSPNGHPIYKIVKVKVLGDTQSGSGSTDNGTFATREQATETRSEKST